MCGGSTHSEAKRAKKSQEKIQTVEARGGGLPQPDDIMAGITEINDDNFDAEVSGSDTPVLLDFWAEWCHPCHMVAPEVEAIAEAEPSRLKVGKLNVDNSPKTAGRFGVFSIPTLLLFVDGEEKARMVGVRRREAILAEIQPYLAAPATA